MSKIFHLNNLIDFFSSIHPVLAAFIATTFTWGLTAFGASFVYFFKTINRKYLDGMLGFTGGVMIAASIWSLLLPAISMAESDFGKSLSWIPASIGFLLGAFFLYFLDRIFPHLHINFEESENEGIDLGFKKTTLLVLAITLHNIPEGLAIGILFGGAALGIEGATIGAAVSLMIGIGLQNLPEGIAVAMPLRRLGLSRRKSFFYGQMSAIVEPIFGVIGALAVVFIEPIMPYALSFAAGSMIYVVVEEVIPETQRDKYTDVATMGFIGGFAIMMILDVALG